MRDLLLAAVLGVIVMGAVVGCGSQKQTGPEPVYPVSGVITYQGRPVAGADVTFFNAEKNRSAFGKTDAQGKFGLSTFSLNDGAVEGAHVVTVAKVERPPETTPSAPLESEEYAPPGMGESTQPGAPKSELPEQYADPATSGLTASVQAAGPNEFSFDLK